jgi:cysteinyl-tRNA synthetase
MRLYNTRTQTTEEFRPLGDTVKMYVCGITPYDESHIGHAMSYIIFDVLRRYLEYTGLQVSHVQNFTDIDDRLIERANALGVTVAELARVHSEAFLADMKTLNVQPAHVYPRATQEIDKMQEMIAGLVASGHAYAAGGDVFYRVRSKDDYGKLAHRSLEGMQAGARVEIDEAKEDPMDFALWKGAKPGEPSWDSPWGPGRPGWHIECSAMSLRYLGETLDIHGGGQDLIFPHHENEIAQTEAYTGVKPSVRTWVHNGWVQVDQEKMSKSLGNFITIREALPRFGPDAIRLWVLGSHYRSPITYSEEILEAAKRGVQRLQAAYALGPREGKDSVDPAPYKERFTSGMDDDLNTAQALAALQELAREINRADAEERGTAEALAVFRELAGVLGLQLTGVADEAGLAAAPFIDLLVEVRSELRAARQWQLADRVRDGLAGLGIEVRDSPEGSTWTRL